MDHPIVHPSPNDANNFSVVARLSDWVPLGKATVDAAIARISDSASGFEPLFYQGIGKISATVVSQLNSVKEVIKLGRTTLVTTGRVTGYEVDGVKMDYKGGVSIVFNDQVEIVSDTSGHSARRGTAAR